MGGLTAGGVKAKAANCKEALGTLPHVATVSARRETGADGALALETGLRQGLAAARFRVALRSGAIPEACRSR